MNYTIEIDKITQAEWQSLVTHFRDYTLYQTWAYQQVRCQMDCQDISRAIVKDTNNCVVAMLQVRIKRIPLAGLRIGYVQSGPLIHRWDEKYSIDPELFALIRHAYLQKVDVLRIVPPVIADSSAKKHVDRLQLSGYYRVTRIPVYHTFQFPLDDEESMRKRFDRTWRSSLKKAEQVGIDIKETTEMEGLEVLKQIYNLSKERKGFAGLDPKVFVKTQKYLPPQEKMWTIVAYHQGKPVSAFGTSYLGHIAHGTIAGSTKEGLQCGASYLCWWRMLLAAKRAGMEVFDLGGIDPKNNPNVYQFKKRMGGEEIFYIGTFDAVKTPSVGIIWRAIESVYKTVQSLKRHIK